MEAQLTHVQFCQCPGCILQSKKPHIYLTEMLSKLIHVPVKHKTSQAGAGMGKKEANGLFTAQGTS